MAVFPKLGIFALTLCCLLNPGCTSVSELLGFGYSRPEVSLRAIDVKSVSMDALNLQVRLRVKNPNSFELVLRKLDYQVQALGMNIAKGLFDKEFKVKAEGQADVSVPMSVNAQNAFKLFKVLMEDPNEQHMAEIDATIVFDSPIGEIEHTFHDEKSLSRLTK